MGQDEWRALLPVMMTRFDALYPSATYQHQVQQLCLHTMLVLFRLCPALLLAVQPTIVRVITAPITSMAQVTAEVIEAFCEFPCACQPTIVHVITAPITSMAQVGISWYHSKPSPLTTRDFVRVPIVCPLCSPALKRAGQPV
ncbi:unnamed protein product [Closterium sp. Yama58-4]|nr:unnamed protein product [Closterium sp. Yama58-4]